MLRADFWKQWEPRVIFPVFKGYENTFDFVVQDTLNGTSYKDYLKPLYHFLKGFKPFAIMWRNYWWILTNAKIKFHYAYLNRDGQLIKEWRDNRSYSCRDVFSVHLSTLLKEAGLPVEDGEFLLIASRGQTDKWSSSPGTITSRYIGAGKICGFRTGLFARPLNSGSKGHFGFTGLNPKIRLDEHYESSILLLNHSSDPAYSSSVTAKVLLYRNPAEFLEAEFGTIPPLGSREQKISELFPQAEEFLRATGGHGYTVTKAKGVTLASLHIFRDRKTGQLLSIEHSRPAHAAVINYGAMKKVKK